LSRCYYLR